MTGITWASVYAFLQARSTEEVRGVVFLVTLGEAPVVQMKLNDREAACPVTYAELAPLVDGYIAAMDIPAKSVAGGEIDIDYVKNRAVVTAFYHDHGNNARKRATEYPF